MGYIKNSFLRPRKSSERNSISWIQFNLKYKILTKGTYISSATEEIVSLSCNIYLRIPNYDLNLMLCLQWCIWLCPSSIMTVNEPWRPNNPVFIPPSPMHFGPVYTLCDCQWTLMSWWLKFWCLGKNASNGWGLMWTPIGPLPSYSVSHQKTKEREEEKIKKKLRKNLSMVEVWCWMQLDLCHLTMSHTIKSSSHWLTSSVEIEKLEKSSVISTWVIHFLNNLTMKQF